MVKGISILEATNEYLIVKIPRRFFPKVEERMERRELTEDEALAICEAAEKAYYAGRTKALSSLKDLR